jgi:hypothetical protein
VPRPRGATARLRSRATSRPFAGLAPNILGVQVAVLGGDDRLNLQNLSGRTIVVFGYDEEPYLRFDAEGRVFRNMRSPATYLNEDRYADVQLPPEADPHASPTWQQVANGNHFAWHDHRIHWMKRAAPPIVREEPRQTHRIRYWKVPATANGEPFAIEGFLGYAPPPAAGSASDDGSWWPPAPLLAGLIALAGGAALMPLLLRRRRGASAREEEREPEEAANPG